MKLVVEKEKYFVEFLREKYGISEKIVYIFETKWDLECFLHMHDNEFYDGKFHDLSYGVNSYGKKVRREFCETILSISNHQELKIEVEK